MCDTDRQENRRLAARLDAVLATLAVRENDNATLRQTCQHQYRELLALRKDLTSTKAALSSSEARLSAIETQVLSLKVTPRPQPIPHLVIATPGVIRLARRAPCPLAGSLVPPG
jgi:hypothetical protein